MSKFIVTIINKHTKEIVKEMPCDSQRQAGKVRDGVEINLNHVDFYVEIKPMHTKDYLAWELQKAGLHSMAAKATEGWYHDYLSPLATPCQQLAEDLEKIKTPEAQVLLSRHLNGEFDASLEESEAWVKSPEGKEGLSQLSPELRKVFE